MPAGARGDGLTRTGAAQQRGRAALLKGNGCEFFTSVRFYLPVACESSTEAVNVCPEDGLVTLSLTVSPGFLVAMYDERLFELVTEVSSILVITSPFCMPALETLLLVMELM